MKSLESFESILKAPLTRRKLLILAGATGFGYFGGKDSVDSPTSEILDLGEEYQRQELEGLVQNGAITDSERKQIILARELSKRVFSKMISARLLAGRLVGFQDLVSPEGVHDQRQKKEPYSVTSEISIYDKDGSSLGFYVVPIFNPHDQLESISLQAHRGGEATLREIADQGVSNGNDGFDFSFIPHENQRTVASKVFMLPKDIVWSTAYSHVFDQKMLEGTFRTSTNNGKVGFSPTQGLPRLDLNFL